MNPLLRRACCPLLVLAILLAGAASASGASFTPGDVVVVRVGDGTGLHAGMGDPVFLDEYTAAGSLVQSVALPATASGPQHQLVLGGAGQVTGSGAEGLVSRSADKRYLVLAGYGRDIGGTGGLSSTNPASVPRVIGRVSATGATDTSTALGDFGGSSGSTPRGVASADGSSFYVSGAVLTSFATDSALRYATLGASASTALSTTIMQQAGFGVPSIAGGQLFASNRGSGTKLGSVGSGLPTGSGETIASVSSTIDSTATTPNAFAFFDLDASVPGNDTLYVADEQSTTSASSATDGVIRKYSFDGSVWTARGTATAVDARGLTGTVAGGTVTLFVSSGGGTSTGCPSCMMPTTGGGALSKLTDATGTTGTLSGVATTIATPAANTGFRGVALAPELSELSRSPSSLAFGGADVDDGATSAQTATITNTGTLAVTLTGVSLAGGGAADFEPLTGGGADCAAAVVLAPGATCDVRVRFDPSATGARSASVTVASGAPDVTVALSGTGTQTSLSASPPSLPFGEQEIDDGPTGAQPSTVTNTGTEPVTLSAPVLGGPGGASFELLGAQAGDCAALTVLLAGETCTARVRFDPASTGAKAATLTVASNAPDVSVALSGAGTHSELTRSPSSLAFGPRDIDDGPTAPQASTVTNAGTTTVTIGSVTLGGADAGAFELLSGTSADCGAGAVLGAGDTCALRVRFDPATVGAKVATVTVGASTGPRTLALSGTGTQTELSRSPAALDFGARNVEDGPSDALASTLTNTGTESVTLGAPGVAGDGAFGLAGGSCAAGAVLAAGQSCTLVVRFAPAVIGPAAAVASVPSTAGAVSVALTGTGTGEPAIALSTGSLAFAARTIGTGASAPLPLTVSNPGSRTLTVGAVTLAGPGAGQFAIVSNGCTGPVARGASCTVAVVFAPATAGARSATLSIDSDAAGSPSFVALGGTGTPQPVPPAPPAKPSRPSLRVGSSGLVLDAAGRLPVRVTCSGKVKCAGTLTLRSKRPRLTLGSAKLSLAPGKTATVTLRPGRAARAAAGKARRLSVTVSVALRDPSSPKTVKQEATRKLTVRRR